TPARQNLRCPSASNAHEESTMNETQDVDVLNQGLQGEYFGIAAYDAALGTKLLSDKVAVVARGFQADHRAHAQASREAIDGLGGRRTHRRRGGSMRHSTRHPSWRTKPTSCATRHRWSAARRSPTRRRWRRSRIRLCGRCSHGSAVSRPCTGRSFVRPSGSRRFRTVSFRLNEQHRLLGTNAVDAESQTRSTARVLTRAGWSTPDERVLQGRT